MKKLTNQEIFDTVWNHFIVNKEPRSTSGGFCRYRGPNGAKCAVGCLIPDEVYDKKFEGSGIEDLIRNYPDQFDHFFLNQGLLSSLQKAHDMSKDDGFTDAYKVDLVRIAGIWGLTIPQTDPK